MKHISILMGAAMVSAGTVSAQEAVDTLGQENGKDVKIELTRVRPGSELSNIIDKDRPQGVQAIPTPKFAIHTPDNKFVMTIGGQVNPIIGCDLGNDLYKVDGAGISFVPNLIPVPAVSGKKSDFYINALNADIDFTVIGLGGTSDQITGYIKFGTNGEDKNIKLKKAYVAWKGFTLGLKSTLFKDPVASQPPTIDPQGPASISGSTYELSYITPSYNGFKAALGIDIPTYYHSSGRYHGKDYQESPYKDLEGKVVCDPTAYNQNVPDIPMWVEWSASEYNRVRVSAILRNFLYRDAVNQEKKDAFGWGVMLSGNWNPIEPLIFYAQAVYGHGIGNYIQDLAGMPLSYTPSDNHIGSMKANPMMSFNFGVTYNINSRWQANAMVSRSCIWDVEPYSIANAQAPGNQNDYRYGIYSAANIFYNISSYFQVGMEYLYGYHKTWNAGGASDNRIQMQFQFSF